MNTRHICCVVALLSVVIAGASAQKRSLGPKDRDTILNARVDPAFSSTPLKQLALLPFTNALDYPEAYVLSDNFIEQMRQQHPDNAVMPPEKTLQIIKENNLGDSYRAFLGNYQNTGVATTAFLQQLGKAAKVDGIIMGRVLAYSVLTEKKEVNVLVGVITLRRNKAVVGMDLKVLRSSDGRELWWGIHAAEGEKAENVVVLSKMVADIFARYFGRSPYS